MKRNSAIFKIFSLCLCLSILIPAPALAVTETQENTFTKLNTTSYDNYSITEYVKSDHTIIRVLERTNAPSEPIDLDLNSNSDIYNQTEQMLLNLGMEQCFIDNLSASDIQTYATSPQIYSAVSYIVVDGETGETSSVSEEVALREAAVINSNSMKQDYIEDTYMRVWHAATYLGNAKYKFVTDSRWLTMPFFRGKDVVGSCAMNCTISDNSHSAYVEYRQQIISNGDISEKVIHNKVEGNNLLRATNGNFYGCAAAFNLPNDIVVNEINMTRYYDYFAHSEYTGHVSFPNQRMFFNTNGTYIHTTLGISATLSLTISTDGQNGVLGLNVTSLQEPRTVGFEVEYTP